jgi:hypothetical protein
MSLPHQTAQALAPSRPTPTLSRAASTAAGALPGTPRRSASLAASGTAISQNVVTPSRPPSSMAAAAMPWGERVGARVGVK